MHPTLKPDPLKNYSNNDAEQDSSPKQNILTDTQSNINLSNDLIPVALITTCHLKVDWK